MIVKATDVLIKEHEMILQMLEILGVASDRLESNESVDSEDLDCMIDFLKTFADKCHHGKEEAILFPAMVDKGISNQHGPIGVMLTEHVQGREYIKNMSEGIAIYKADRSKGRAEISKNAAGYIQLLTQHIMKENNVLFQMADKVFSILEQQELVIRFDEAEEREVGNDVQQKYKKIADELKLKYIN